MNSTTESLAILAVTSEDMLTDVLRNGARQLLARAIEARVGTWIVIHKQLVDESGHRMIVRNGHMPRRSIVTGVGSVAVTQPRVYDLRPDGAIGKGGRPVQRFRSEQRGLTVDPKLSTGDGASGSGRPCGRYPRLRARSAARYTKRPTRSRRSPSGSSQMPRRC